MSVFKNGKPWLDTDGNVIHAHGGCMLRHDGWYYWYGENRDGENYISCYRSKDLQSFEFCSNIITMETPTEPSRVRADLSLFIDDPIIARRKVNLERPKVLYCEYTKKFVLWAHYENGQHYHDARCAVAESDYPDRGFVYHGSFRPFGQMSRDCTLFLDDDGRAYFIAAARDNAELRIWRLAKDFLNVEKEINILWPDEYREAPAIFKKDGRYFMVNSGTTGWAPNQSKWSCADSLDGEWALLENFGDATTFDTQGAFILPLEKADGMHYVYFSDRWGGKGRYNESTYVALDIQFDETGAPFIVYSEKAAL